MTCTICNHPQRRDIDLALINGSVPLASLSQEFCLSTSALHRHKAHLQAKLNQAKDQLQANLHQGCIFWLSQALAIAMQTAQAAHAENNGKEALQAVGHVTRIVSIILKQDFTPDQGLVFQILNSPEWVSQTSLLPGDPQMLALIRQAQAAAITSPCPDTPAHPPAPDLQTDQDPAEENPLCPVQPVAQPQTENRKLKTANRLSKLREKSGKSPGKPSTLMDIKQNIQEDKLFEKITGIMACSPLAKAFPLENQTSKLENLLAVREAIPKDKPLSEYIYEQSLKGKQYEPNKDA